MHIRIMLNHLTIFKVFFDPKFDKKGSRSYFNMNP